MKAPSLADTRTRTAVIAVRRNPLLSAGAVIALALVAAAVLAPLVAPYPQDAGTAMHAGAILLAPSWNHPFGTDMFGRDIFTRVLYGARVSLGITGLVLAISVAIGVPLGIVAGYFGGFIDNVIMRVTDVFLAFPALLLALAFATVLGASTRNAVLAIAIAWWPWYARLARGQAASVAGRGFIEACRALGVGRVRMLWRHVLPNSLTPLIVSVSLDAGGVILTAAALSFLGLGAQDPTPEWGLMVSQGQSFFTTQWWLVTFPGLAIMLTAMAFNLAGDGLREILDPRRVVTR